MAKLLIAALAVAGLAAAAQYGLRSRAPQPESAPHQQLRNVREAAGRIEGVAQQRVDEALRRTSDAPQP